MVHCMKSIYDSRTAQTIERITEGKETYCLNTVYTNSVYGWKWYCNSKGYFHILGIKPMRLDGKIIYYCIENMLLKSDDMLKSDYEGQYFTLEEAQKALENYRV